MNSRIILLLIVVGFVVFCGWLVLGSGLCETCRSETGPCVLLQQTTITEGQEGAKAAGAKKVTLEAADFEEIGKIIGSLRLPTLTVQEGGYDTRVLGINALNFFKGLWAGTFEKK